MRAVLVLCLLMWTVMRGAGVRGAGVRGTEVHEADQLQAFIEAVDQIEVAISAFAQLGATCLREPHTSDLVKELFAQSVLPMLTIMEQVDYTLDPLRTRATVTAAKWSPPPAEKFYGARWHI